MHACVSADGKGRTKKTLASRDEETAAREDEVTGGTSAAPFLKPCGWIRKVFCATSPVNDRHFGIHSQAKLSNNARRKKHKRNESLVKGKS